MAALTVFDHLALHPFTGDLSARWLQRLAVHGRPVQRHPGYRLFTAGGPATGFWLLRSGTLQLDLPVPGRGDVVIERVGTDGVAGWSWLLPPYRWTLGAVVVEPARMVEFDAAAVRRLLAADPDLGRELMTRFLRVMAHRLHASRRRVAELYAYPADPAAPAAPVDQPTPQG